MVKKKAPLRVGETHVQAVRDTFPGAVLDAAWQAEDQVTVTVPKDMLPDVVEFLYYGRGGWLPNMVANDERPINGNYALDAGLTSADALAVETATGAAAEAYVNVLTVKEGRENDEAILALAKALQSEEVRSFIDEKYSGGVVALF